MTIQQQFHELRKKLETRYDNREAGNIADMVMENITGQSRSERMMLAHDELTAQQENNIIEMAERLLKGVPVQYVLEEAWFMNRRFFVNQDVLIPRPETEELVHWMIAHIIEADPGKSLRVIDIGTGSGCIPVSLKLELPCLEVHALDVSEAALNVAKRNASALGAEIEFHHTDFTDPEKWEPFHGFDMIISNPPYIPLEEKNEMEPHVVEQEPHLALFVPDNDPYLFYRLIAAFASQKLAPGGTVFMEIHADAGENIRHLFKQTGFSDIEVKKDMQGKDRMVKARKTAVY